MYVKCNIIQEEFSNVSLNFRRIVSYFNFIFVFKTPNECLITLLTLLISWSFTSVTMTKTLQNLSALHLRACAGYVLLMQLITNDLSNKIFGGSAGVSQLCQHAMRKRDTAIEFNQRWNIKPGGKWNWKKQQD